MPKIIIPGRNNRKKDIEMNDMPKLIPAKIGSTSPFFLRECNIKYILSIKKRMPKGLGNIDETWGQINEVNPKIIDKTKPIRSDLKSSFPRANIMTAVTAMIEEFKSKGTKLIGEKPRYNDIK